MQGDIVAASRWLGASIVIASGVIAGGLRWGRPSPVEIPASPAASAQHAPLDADVLRQSTEATTGEGQASQAGVTACVAIGESGKVPILDPLPAGSGPASCLDPPSEAEVWDKVPKFKTGSPVFYETQRNNVRILVEKIGEKVDPCKVYPLAGPCQLVHCHYKCSVYFDELYWADYPIPFNHRKARVEVVFIDKDHLRRCGGPATTFPQP